MSSAVIMVILAVVIIIHAWSRAVSAGNIHAIVRGSWIYTLPWCSDIVFTGRVSSLRRPSDQARAITILSYRNEFFCYSRTVAYFSGSAMLYSSDDSPQSASSNLSGMDSMKCNQENHRSLFLRHPTHLAQVS
jgi:hypothetical protein